MKSFLLAMCGAVVLCTAGCNEMPFGAVHRAHEAVRRLLIDGDSAKFRDDEIAKDGSVCGFVNSKNRMGAYVGFTPYVHTAASELTFLSPGDPDFTTYFRYEDNEFVTRDEISKISDACLFVSTWQIWCGDSQKAAMEDAATNCKLWGGSTDDQEKLKAKLGIN